MHKQLVPLTVIDGAFSDYADSMKNKGYNVKELDGEANISNETLKNAHILVMKHLKMLIF